MSTTAEGDGDQLELKLIYSVFFVSGMAALLYQLVWQRMLFTIYGTNSEAITAIVAAFMLGLGLGSLGGGAVSARFGQRLVALFAAAELSIGLFGLISVPLLRAVGQATAGVDALSAGALSFALIVVPTCLMGATLPLLLAHLVRRRPDVGQAIGDLYYVNTLGSALVCIMASLFLFRWLGLSGAAWFAAACNIAVALVAFVAFRRGAQEPTTPREES